MRGGERWVAAVLLATLALAGCGRKGPPVAPERRLPQPVGDLGAVVRDGAIELAWTNPTRRMDNTRLRDLAAARVYRVEDDGAGEPRPALLVRDRVAGYTEVVAIRLEAPAPATVETGRVRWPDREGLAYGRRYTYVVITADAQGRWSPPSRRLSVAFVPAPEPPRDLRVDAGEQEARLTWAPPARLLDGSDAPAGAIAYEVLRAPEAEAPLAPVTRTRSGETRLTDRGLENDRTYYYAVRAIRSEGTTLAFGPPSARVAVTPRDMTPPAPPSNLVAVPSEGVVRLAWSPSPDADVAAYIVYRADAGGLLVRVGSTRPPSTVFLDRNVPRGVHRYVVTAEDSAVRPNESGRSNEVSVTVP